MAATARKKASSSAHVAASAAVAEIDDILGEIDAPAKVEAEDRPDEIPATVADAAYSLEDILGDFEAPPPANEDDSLDDILSEIAPPAAAPAEPAESLDHVPGTLAPVSVSPAADVLDQEPAGPAMPASPGGNAGLEAAPDAAVPASTEAEASVDHASEEPETAPAKRPAALSRIGLPSLRGTRQISRKAHLGLIGAAVLFGLTTAAETAFIAMHGVGHGEAKPQRVVVTTAPVDYAQIDLSRYAGKRRTLREGGRDVLRNGAVKAAILDLDNGEDLYRDIRDIARRSPAADHMTIGDNRITVLSCDAGVCGDKSFRLVYDIVRKHASVCVTEKYLNNSFLSYNYSEEGYSEVPACR